MPGVSAKISVLDAMTPAIEHMYRGVSQLISGMYKLNEATSNSFDMSPFLEAQKSMAEAVAVQRRMENEYRQMASGAQQAQAAQNAYTGSVNTSDNAQRRHSRTVEQINTALKQIDSTAKSLITTQKQIENEYNRMRQSVAQIESVQTQLNSATVEIPVLQKQIISNQEQLVNKYQQVKECIEQAGTAQKQYNNSVIQGVNNVTVLGDRLAASIKRYVTIAASAYSGKQLIDASDTWTNNSARLGLITDSLAQQNVLQQKIYQSAKETRGSYNDMVDVTAKLGLLAGDAFGSNTEIVKFTGLMQKSFKLSGASTQERQSAMYQLTQAMASGRLQGDEFRSIIENAPMLANAIAEYTGVGRKGLKDLSSDGAISAEIIKNSLFSAADDIESKFSTLPMTFGDAWTNALSDATMAFSPLYEQMNNMLNSDFGQSVVSELPNSMAWLAEQAQEALRWAQDLAVQGAPGLAELGGTIKDVVSEFVDANGVINVVAKNIVSIFGSEGARISIRIYATAIGSVAKGLSSVLSVMTPLLPYITSTYIMFKSYKTLTSIFNPIATSIQGISSSFITVTTSIESATVAQSTFNAVCNTNVLFAIASVVLGIASAWSQVAAQEKYAAECAVANNNINTALQSGIDNVTAGDYAKANGVDINTAKSILATQKEYEEQIAAINEEQESKRYTTDIYYGQYYKYITDEAMHAITKIAKPNTMGEGFEGFKSWALTNVGNFLSDPVGTLSSIGHNKVELTFDNSKIKYSEYNKSLGETARRTAELEKQMNDQIQAYKDGYKELKEMEKTKAGDGTFDVGDVDNVNHINDTVDIASEDLRYMRDLAEQETINQFTSKLVQPQINVTFGEVKETADVDAITKRITDGLIESLNNSSDAVHI